MINWYTNVTNQKPIIYYRNVISNILDSKLLYFVVLVTTYYIYKCFGSQTRPNKDDLIEEGAYNCKNMYQINVKYIYLDPSPGIQT